ncbi:MAG TPA: toast rack family protein [bacterium]|nr:toast rack family protein [bacterium]
MATGERRAAPLGRSELAARPVVSTPAAISKLMAALVALALVLGVVGCQGRVKVGPLETETISTELSGARAVDAKIVMGAGTLNIAGGSARLLDAEFRYNVAEWKPRMDYKVSEGHGTLLVEQPHTGKTSLAARIHNEWDLKLAENVPLNLAIEMGAGRGRLDLGSLSLGKLNINAGAGQLEVDLTGTPSVTRLDLKFGAGAVKLDLTGEWKADLDAHIDGGVGAATLRLPTDVGVRVTAKHGFGSVNAGGFARDGDAYVNEAYGNSKVTLNINVATGLGEINLEQGSSAEESGDTGT